MDKGPQTTVSTCLVCRNERQKRQSVRLLTFGHAFRTQVQAGRAGFRAAPDVGEAVDGCVGT
jgi:hypothetical protein